MPLPPSVARGRAVWNTDGHVHGHVVASRPTRSVRRAVEHAFCEHRCPHRHTRGRLTHTHFTYVTVKVCEACSLHGTTNCLQLSWANFARRDVFICLATPYWHHFFFLHAFTTCVWCENVPSRSKEEGVISPLFSVHHRSLSVFTGICRTLELLHKHTTLPRTRRRGVEKPQYQGDRDGYLLPCISHARANRFAAWSSASRAMSLDARCTSPLRS